MRRDDLHALASAKIRDAGLLLMHSRWSNAYYLAGYSIELGLKACISRQVSADTIPDKAILTGIHTHNFGQLIGLAGLKVDLANHQRDDPQFAANWAIVNEWTPDARYKTATHVEAQLIISAIADEDHGVLAWIRTYW
ncbi:hypothetical protein [Brucella anthropi]|uniref:HEPN domain-containing protein n=1 Tax=Brucella anthropi TaxID=529 RepID=A0A6L3Z915_BRUAN|nr:hypothetical protein [Brucella anthropi]KAB2772427.1 hypothetical protein F9L04_06815 [Brucella anthropi]UVV69944.1 hypothetical protein NW321_15325 [Brucella anthropi]